MKKLQRVYKLAESQYEENRHRYNMPKKPIKNLMSDDRHKENVQTLHMLETCFNEIVKSANYSELFFNFCNIVLTYQPDDMKKSFELMLKKREDYGIKPLLITGQIGVVVRIIAKLCRLVNLHDKEMNFESISDNRMDIFNYGIIGIQMITGELK